MRDVPARPVSYWMEYGEAAAHPPPPDGLDVEVAVIGAGIAGICTAWELARAGKSVALLEADRIAAGVTGNTTAKLSALHGIIYQRLRGTRGVQGAALYARSQQDAIGHVVAVCEELGIDCDLERAPAFTYAETAKEARTVEAEAEAAREAGLPASYVKETGLPFPVAGAVRVAEQAQFHPRKYLYGLTADLERRGGRIFEGTRVVGLREGSPCRLTTEDSRTVLARDVVVATHYPVFDRALLFARLKPHRELVVAGLIPAAQDPLGMYLTPEGTTRSVRTAPYGDGQRLLIVTGEKFTPGAGRVGARYERLAKWTTQRFPDVRLTHRWAAQDNEPTDGVPFVGALHPRARHTFVAAGFNSWGMAGGVMSGKLLAARITGQKLPWTDLYDPVRLKPLKEAPALMRFQAAAAGHFVGDRLPFVTGGGPASAIAPGAGAVVRSGARQVAVHRDDGGELHALSARCTHLGCIVRFNDGERTWECPCHGSRFGIGGEVLQGPALRPLERVHDFRDSEDDGT